MFPEIFRDDVFRLETRRLWLRWPTARDESAIERLAGDADVAAMTKLIPHPYPKDGAASFIYGARVSNAQGSALTFALAPIARPHEAIGIVSIAEDDGIPSLGFWLGKPFWNRAYMSEAAQTMTRAVFALTTVTAIGASVRIDNLASRRVLEKCGFVQTGERAIHSPAREAMFDCADYRLERLALRERSAFEQRTQS